MLSFKPQNKYLPLSMLYFFLILGLSILGCGKGWCIPVDPTYYVGIGNSTPGDPDGKAADDIGNALFKAVPGLKKTVQHNKGGRDILAALNIYKNDLKSCDLFIFYYIGHGWPEAQDNPPLDPDEEKKPGAVTSWDEYIGKPGEGFDKLARDDEIASILASFPKCVTKIVIFDSCFSGGMVGGTDDIDAKSKNTAWLLSAAEDARDPGINNFASALTEALKVEGKTFKGDSNKDLKLDIDEWLKYAAENTKDGTKVYNWNIDDDHWKPVAVIPEPATIFLLGSGLIGLAAFRKKLTR